MNFSRAAIANRRTPVTSDEVTLYASDSPLVVGAWTRTTDASAAGGFRLQNANAGAAKITTAQADPADYFELTFRADAGKPYRLWIRGKAGSNNWASARCTASRHSAT